LGEEITFGDVAILGIVTETLCDSCQLCCEALVNYVVKLFFVLGQLDIIARTFGAASARFPMSWLKFQAIILRIIGQAPTCSSAKLSKKKFERRRPPPPPSKVEL
jgi:hypothetical protein